MKDPQTLAYTAGIIDGEGSITLTYMNKGDKFRSPIVSVSNTDVDIILFLYHTFHGNIIRKKIYKSHHLQSYVWSLQYQRAIDFLETIFPYLRQSEKLRRAELLITHYKNLTIRNGRYSDEQIQAKLLMEEEFFHPTIICRKSTIDR